ncbi:MAG: cell division FtsA domain-containing protein [candidate division WWE3 bacterium]|nr:cell division FtsA domain-containing protein [candidate division WWE3 bacterium]
MLKKNYTGALNTILLDIGGETTDIAVIFGGGITGNRTLGLGGRFFSQIISERLGNSINEAELKKISYGEKRLPEDQLALISESLKDLIPVFLKGLEVGLSDIEGIKLLPSEILISGGGSLLPDVVKFISDPAWSHNLPIKGELKVRNLMPPDLGLPSDNILGPEYLPAIAIGLLNL